MTTEQLEALQYDCHLAALRAIDSVLSDNLGYRKVWVRDEELPALLPALDRAIAAALRAAGKDPDIAAAQYVANRTGKPQTVVRGPLAISVPPNR
jgi:hypothetical protein